MMMVASSAGDLGVMGLDKLIVAFCSFGDMCSRHDQRFPVSAGARGLAAFRRLSIDAGAFTMDLVNAGILNHDAD